MVVEYHILTQTLSPMLDRRCGTNPTLTTCTDLRDERINVITNGKPISAMKNT